MSTTLIPDPTNALTRGTRLGEFEIMRVLGVGGFGIVYLAFDHALEREVAIKEYMPASLAGRGALQEVSVLSQSNAEPFALGLRSFVNEARLLARYDHPALVKVYRYWEANGTAYMAMRYYAGRNLQQVRKNLEKSPSEAWIRSIVEPLLGALEWLHRDGVFHRDISPDNILIEPDGRPVLLDFGAARRVISDKSVALTAMLKPSYAPIEQYGEAPGLKQGPWTDMYALGATIHFLLTGAPPQPSTTRIVHDNGPFLGQMSFAECSEPFLRCIDWMLRPRPADRPHSVAELKGVLSGGASVPALRPQDSPATSQAGRSPQAEAQAETFAPTIIQPPGAPQITSSAKALWEPTHRERAPAAATQAVPAPRRPGWPWLGGAAAAVAVTVAALLAWQGLKSPEQALATSPRASETALTATPAGVSPLGDAPAASAAMPPAVSAASGLADSAEPPPPSLAAARQAPTATRASPAPTSALTLSTAKPTERTPRPATLPAAATTPSAAAQPLAAAASAPITVAPKPAEAPAQALRAPTPAEESDAMVVRSRALSPSELCEGTNLLLKTACIAKQCNASPALRNHPDCVQARHENR